MFRLWNPQSPRGVINTSESITFEVMNDKPKESDWKVIRGMVPDLRERYLQARN